MPFPAIEIIADIRFAEAFEGNLAGHKPLVNPTVALDQANAAIDPVPPAREKTQTPFGIAPVARLGQDSPSQRDHGIGSKQQITVTAVQGIPGGKRLLLRQTARQRARQLTPDRSLVDIGGADRIRHDANLSKKLQTPGRPRRQDQARPCGMTSHQGGRPI